MLAWKLTENFVSQMIKVVAVLGLMDYAPSLHKPTCNDGALN